jgi:hypothetical protein
VSSTSVVPAMRYLLHENSCLEPMMDRWSPGDGDRRPAAGRTVERCVVAGR